MIASFLFDDGDDEL